MISSRSSVGLNRVITPRRTRLLRVRDLQSFREVIRRLARQPDVAVDARVVVVPTRRAAQQLERTLGADSPRPLLVTRDELYAVLHARLRPAPECLTALERDSIVYAASREAQASLPPPGLSFHLRPGLVAEILRFYDQLRRQSQAVSRAEALLTEALDGAAEAGDRGAERMLRQTQFLVRTFHAYERRVGASGALDEHGLRNHLLSNLSTTPIRHAIVTVGDWIAEPGGLFVADFDMLARLPGLNAIDVIGTDAVLASGYLERIRRWLPGLDEADGDAADGRRSGTPSSEKPSRDRRPVLVAPDADDRNWFTFRDREEELVAVARRLQAEGPHVWRRLERTAVVYNRPLPYLYLAADTLGAAGVSFRATGSLPLAAEPTAAAVDLVLELVETRFTRDALVALLRSPHFDWQQEAATVFQKSVSALDRALSDARFLGELEPLEVLVRTWQTAAAAPAANAALGAARDLAALLDPSPSSVQIARLRAFLNSRWQPLDECHPCAMRERRARAAIDQLLAGLQAAHAVYHDSDWTIAELAAAVHQAIDESTFNQEGSTGSTGSTGSNGSTDVEDGEGEGVASAVQLVDDQAARYGDFDDIHLVGLIDGDWPDRPRRNIFYPPALLKALGWPSEQDRRAAAEAHFLDLLASASRRVILSTLILDDEALVTRSMFLDEIPRAGLTCIRVAEPPGAALLLDERVAPSTVWGLAPDARAWADLRARRSPASDDSFHGQADPIPPQSWPTSGLETYLDCPFKFFARHVLRLREDPDDEEVMDPRRHGELVHRVFERFFAEWQSTGHRAVTPETLAEAQAMFTSIVDRTVGALPASEGALERTRLLGSSAAAGIGEAVLRMEAERPANVVERLLECPLEGQFTISTATGPRVVSLRGRADRIDLLDDGSFRLIDYKVGWPPTRARALQLPMYGICAEQRLANHRGGGWVLGEAVYLAFKGPRRVVPLFASPASRAQVLASAQQRVADALDAIERGEFPPRPVDTYLCETCAFSAVCRKDYVDAL